MGLDLRPSQTRTSPRVARRLALLATAGIALYLVNERVWDLLLFDLVGLRRGTRLADVVHFFLYDTTKILLLVAGLVFVIAYARSALPVERVRDLIGARHVAIGYLLAAVFGAFTPFCSCSSVPLFIGFVAAGIPPAITLTFLVASPLINEVGVVMLAGMVGWHIAALYVLAGMALAIVAGVLLGRLPLERWIDPVVLGATAPSGPGAARPSRDERLEAARRETGDVLRSILPYVVVGIAIGAVIHGWLPQDFFLDSGLADHPLAVPAATLIGIPLYANVAGVVPLVEALYSKGVGLGTAMAFMMSVVALSLPSLVLLRRVMRLPLLAWFTATVAAGIVVIGLLFDLIG
ncbi:MAG TPA: permease [Egicoccus sp.]|nr:permease [Egicoccus sp.]HSK23376.1 permease [Egicoccus sp.]